MTLVQKSIPIWKEAYDDKKNINVDDTAFIFFFECEKEVKVVEKNSYSFFTIKSLIGIIVMKRFIWRVLWK